MNYSIASPPKNNITMIRPINEITNPAIAKPFDGLNAPIAEKITPNNQMIFPKNGIHPKNKPINAKTNPAIPNPFDGFFML